MPGRPFRFLHASDFHLELPLFGVTEVPTQLREVFLDAPYSAARRVFDTALAEEVDFVLLTGDIINPPNAGPCGVLFLIEQFERLAEKDIRVYWAGGRVDPPTSWPSTTPPPKNVRIFPAGDVKSVSHRKHEEPLARIVGLSRDRSEKIRPAEFIVANQDIFTIASVHGRADMEKLLETEMNFWALGGEHNRNTPSNAPHWIHYPGSPQGRQPGELGPHGCTVVHVDERRQVTANFVSCDAVRWVHEQLNVHPNSTQADVVHQMSERLRSLADVTRDVHQLVTWTISGEGPLASRLRHSHGARPIIENLRDRFGHSRPCVWTVALEVESTVSLPDAWHEEDTLLGEFLRHVQVLQHDSHKALRLEKLLSNRYQENGVAASVQLSDLETRQRVLRRAAALGADLLRGEGPTAESYPHASIARVG